MANVIREVSTSITTKVQTDREGTTKVLKPKAQLPHECTATRSNFDNFMSQYHACLTIIYVKAIKSNTYFHKYNIFQN